MRQMKSIPVRSRRSTHWNKTRPENKCQPKCYLHVYLFSGTSSSISLVKNRTLVNTRVMTDQLCSLAFEAMVAEVNVLKEGLKQIETWRMKNVLANDTLPLLEKVFLKSCHAVSHRSWWSHKAPISGSSPWRAAAEHHSPSHAVLWWTTRNTSEHVSTHNVKVSLQFCARFNVFLGTQLWVTRSSCCLLYI